MEIRKLTIDEICTLNEKKQRRRDGSSLGGRASKKNNTKSITIRRISTDELFDFDEINQCLDFLQVSRATLWHFTKGDRTILNNDWQLIENE